MCMTCGCSSDEKHAHEHSHDHPHDHSHEHAHDRSHEKSHSNLQTLRPSADRKVSTIALEERILQKNNALAESNRRWLQSHKIIALNILGGPGSGKTAILERTINALNSQFKMAVIEGDQETENDAQRIRATGCPVVQINTGAGCHLDAQMLSPAFIQLNPADGSFLFVENVGNLVCPALFDLGESCKVVVLSVTEGEDKPRKYPHMFRAAQLMLLNKIDLLPHLKFKLDACIKNALAVNPDLKIIQISASTGEGFEQWIDWLKKLST